MILKHDKKYCHVDNGNKAHKYTAAVGVSDAIFCTPYYVNKSHAMLENRAL
jgi:uncharacterized C2H2 Zn-finger protein